MMKTVIRIRPCRPQESWTPERVPSLYSIFHPQRDITPTTPTTRYQRLCRNDIGAIGEQLFSVTWLSLYIHASIIWYPQIKPQPVATKKQSPLCPMETAYTVYTRYSEKGTRRLTTLVVPRNLNHSNPAAPGKPALLIWQAGSPTYWLIDSCNTLYTVQMGVDAMLLTFVCAVTGIWS
jgi:hypothetical protein